MQEYCDLAKNNIEQLYEVSTLCIDESPVGDGGTGGGVRITNLLLSNLPEMHVLVAHRQICYFVVCTQTGKSSHEMDQSL